MKLEALLNGVDVSGNLTAEMRQVTSLVPVRDSREAGENSVFFAIEGFARDGHDYAKAAAAQGATAVVVERDLGLERQLVVEDTHLAYSVACANYFGNPAKQLKLLAVTGTNGKTTVTYLVRDILHKAGYKVGLLGSIQNIVDQLTLPARHTTPDPFQLHSLFARMVRAGCQYAVLEASSHAMTQKRLQGCQFLVSAFTNLTQDHLDYHGSMEAYFGAKKELFLQSDYGVFNLDDPEIASIIAEYPDSLTFSVKDPSADLYAENISFTQRGSRFTFCYQGQKQDIQFVQPGLFSVSNALTAAGICLRAGLSFQQVVEGLEACKGVAGRFEIIPADSTVTVVRDFAHSPDGLEKLLSTAKKFATGRVVTLFGCAGERDRTKRPAMASTVAEYSDFCIITSDNPRSEDPQQIINDALPGFADYPKVPYRQFIDRLEAIRWALAYCSGDDLLVLAGKGHEDYQVLEYGTVYFNEREIVLETLGTAERERE